MFSLFLQVLYIPAKPNMKHSFWLNVFYADSSAVYKYKSKTITMIADTEGTVLLYSIALVAYYPF